MADEYTTSEGKVFRVPDSGLARLALRLIGVPHLGYRARLQRYRHILRGLRSGMVVDLGCGYGFAALELDAEVRYIGVDSNPERVAAVTGENREGIVADISAVPDECRGADVVILSEVLEHVGDPAAVLTEAHRILKPGGTLIVTAPAPAPEDRDRFGHVCDGFTGDAITALIGAVGFTVSSVAPYGAPLFRHCWLLQRRLLAHAFLATFWYLLCLPVLKMDGLFARNDAPIGWIVIAANPG